MTITAMTEYSDSASELIAHKTMLEVSSWGQKYYIDFEQYCTQINETALIDYTYMKTIVQVGEVIRNVASNILFLEEK